MTSFGLMVDSSQESQLQAIDAEIKSLEESIQVLKTRRNALAPVSSLPTELIGTIFSFLCLPASGTTWLSVTHVCHQWREIALGQSFFWSHVDFTNLTSAGAAEILARAKKAPLHLEARVTGYHWDNARTSAFEKELQSCLSHMCRLSINTELEAFDLRKTLEGLASPAPTLEHLSLSNNIPSFLVSFPDTLFDGTAPKLSRLRLHNFDISWKSPLLKGLRYLEVRTPSEDVRPSLADWLDALDEMRRLEKLVLHRASPIGPHLPPDIMCMVVKRTVTLPFLTHLDVSASTGDCAIALAHLNLPTLTWLCVTAMCVRPLRSDVFEFVPYVTRHAHGPQDARPLQSVLIHADGVSTDILAWPMPDIVVPMHDPATLRAATLTARVALSIHNIYTDIGVLDAAITALSLDNLVTLTAQHHTRLNEQFWLRQASRWPLLQRVRLAAPAAHGFREMLLQENNERECPPLPSLTRLDLICHTASSARRRTLGLRDALMMRVEQGVPLEILDLRTCRVSSHAVRQLGEIVVDVLGPEALPFKLRLDDNSDKDDDDDLYASDIDEEEE